MAKKMDPEKAQEALLVEIGRVFRFAEEVKAGLPDQIEHAYEFVAICVHRAVEQFVFGLVLASVNRDATQIALADAGIRFPKHMTVEACEFVLLRGKDYFDLKNSQTLAEFCARFLPEKHTLNSTILTRPDVRAAVDRLCALRNLAAHRESETAKRRAKKALGMRRLGSAGEYLSRNGKLARLQDDALTVGAGFRHAFNVHHPKREKPKKPTDSTSSAGSPSP